MFAFCVHLLFVSILSLCSAVPSTLCCPTHLDSIGLSSRYMGSAFFRWLIRLWTLFRNCDHTHTHQGPLLCFQLLIVINFCLSVLCIKSDLCIYHISKQVSTFATIATFVGDSSDCKLRLRLRLRTARVSVNYSGSSEDLKRRTQFAWLHSLDAVARAVKYLADFAYFRFKDKVPTVTKNKKQENLHW